jgi:Tfp pilus assembly pilus retraction ATPase PilT
MTTITDWRINLETGKSVYFPGAIEVETSEHPVAAGIRDFLLEEIARTFENPMDQFSARIQQVFYRFQRLTPSLYSLRVVPSQIPEIQTLGHRSSITRALLDENYNRGGLVLISGAAGSGKSTTAASVVRERLRRYGGYCLTIEDPIEYYLEGFHGAGFCNQIEASDTKDYQAQVMRAKRAFPAKTLGMLYMGEIRDSFNLISAIQNYLELMDVENSNIARYTAASCLKLIVCQRWLRGERMVSDMLPINDAAMAAIKNGALHTLKDAIANVEAKIRSQVS